MKYTFQILHCWVSTKGEKSHQKFTEKERVWLEAQEKFYSFNDYV